jgi:predicted metal-dependent hydrolase
MPELLSDIKLEEISFVDSPANPGAQILLYKRSASDAQPKEAEMADDMTPEQETRMKAYMDKGYDKDKAREMAMAKFAPEIDGMLEEMDSLEKTNNELTERQMNIEMSLQKEGIVLEEDGSITKSASPEYIDIDGEKVLKSSVPAPLLKRMEESNRRIEELEKRDREIGLAKRADEEIPHLAGESVAKGYLLDTIEKMEQKDELLRTLKAADEALKKMGSEVGAASVPDDDSPDSRLSKMTQDYAKEHGVSIETAYAEVTRDGEGRQLLKSARTKR